MTTTIMLWYLITCWGQNQTSVMIPMQSKEACLTAMAVHGNYCVNTKTGEIIDR